MNKFQLTYMAIAMCGLFATNPISAEGGDGGGDGGGFDGGGFDGGSFDGGSFDGGGFDGGGFDGGGYDGGFDGGSYDGGNFDSGNFDGYEGSGFDGSYDAPDQLESNNDIGGGFDQGDLHQGNFNQTDAIDGGIADQSEPVDFSDDANLSSDANQPSDVQTGQAFDPGSESAQHKEINSEAHQTGDAAPNETSADINPATPDNAADQHGEFTKESTGATDQSTTANDAKVGTEPATQSEGAVQDGASNQNVNIENNVQTNPHTGNFIHDGHHHHGHHHHLDGFGLGLGVGLGLGWGFGPSWGWGWGPGWGFSTGWGWNTGWSWGPGWGGVGFYNNYTFGPYRRFGVNYVYGGGYPVGVVSAPIVSSPTLLAPVTPTYIQQNAAPRPAPVQRNTYWYYCRNPEGYYPQVKQCSGEWIKVLPRIP